MTFLAKWLALGQDATHLDIYFLPCIGAFPVLGWSPESIAHLLSSPPSALGRPSLEQLIEYRSDDLVMLCSPSADVVTRCARVVPLKEDVQGALFARELRVVTISPHEFPSKRTYDSVRTLTRAKWNLHNRAKLHVDIAQDIAHDITQDITQDIAQDIAPSLAEHRSEATVYIRYNHSKNVDARALHGFISRGTSALMAALYESQGIDKTAG